MKKIPVGVLGATGMVGQRFVELLSNHPWFEIKVLAASPKSSGKSYKEAVSGRWVSKNSVPKEVARIKVLSAEDDMEEISKNVRLVFSAMDLDKNRIKKIEEAYAASGVFVVSNNSAHRDSADVPMIIPEVNPHHLDIIENQRKSRGWKTGGIIVKSNCSIQSYVAVLEALSKFEPAKVVVTSTQAISGAGKTFERWPEMIDNVIPYIGGEEEKSEQEPLKIWGKIRKGKIVNAKTPTISATCIRVPVTDGHMASVSVKFGKKVTQSQVVKAIKNYKNPIEKLKLPSSPKSFIQYFEDEDRPQTKTERNLGNGMTISVGRIRKDSILDYKFVALSHNILRGAAGGAVLAAELLRAKNFI